MQRSSYTKLILSLTCLVICLLPACRHPGMAEQASDTKVTNGLEIAESRYPAVVRLSIGGTCTGTFVSSTTLITAAHCVLDNRGGTAVVRVPKLNATSSQVIVHPNANGRVSPVDLAVVVFPARTSPDFIPISTTQPRPGEELTIIGYGNNDHVRSSGAGTKRMGTNVLRSTANGFLEFNGETRNLAAAGDGQNVASSNGDSGGPMLISDKLVGVTSGGSIQSGRKLSFYINLNLNTNMTFLRSTIARGAKIPSLTGETDPDASPPIAGGGSSAISKDLFVALGIERSDGRVTLGISAAANVSRVVFCKAEGISLCQSGAQSTVKTLTLAGRGIFVAQQPYLLEEEGIISVVAYDSSGTLVSALAVKSELN